MYLSRSVVIKLACLLLILGVVSEAGAQWANVKMHFPQRPDPQGWDVCLRQMAVADDFLCTQTGPLTGINFWISWKDNLADNVMRWEIAIYSDANGRPGEPLWKYQEGNLAILPETPAPQGWLCPCSPAEAILPDNHTWRALVIINEIKDPFQPTQGNTYWLVVRANTTLYDPLYAAPQAQPEVGWENALDHWRQPAQWQYWPLNTTAVGWRPLMTPAGAPIDMAFVLTGENTQPPALDFGDADENKCDDPALRCNRYPTTLAHDGARHLLAPGVFLGSPLLAVIQIDPEPDGQPSTLADGDNRHGVNDEQGVQLPPYLVPGTSATALVQASTHGYIDAWIDFNADGDWDDPGERICYSSEVNAGPNNLNFPVPPTENDTAGKMTFARFRFSTAGRLNYFGLAQDGEVEDYLVAINPDPQPRLDFGDAPDGDFAPSGYPTLRITNGARHKINPAVKLGRYIDGEIDGQVSPAADGDDVNDLDDEDGVYFSGPLIPGQAVEIKVIASCDGFLNAWVDFDANGNWTGPADRVFVNRKLVPGVNNLTIAVPPATAGAASRITYARFRFTSQVLNNTIGFAGLAEDGEVEDYRLRIESPNLAFDFGDAPELRCDDATVARCNSYPTTLSRNGARHIIVPGMFLGSPFTDVVHLDGEPDGRPSLKADGDDATQADDEDGVDFVTPISAGMPATVVVQAGTVGKLDAWIDFNADGDWDEPGEQIFISEPLAPGGNTLKFRVPPFPAAIPTIAGTYARFRFSSEGGLAYAGPARDGEVEDYWVRVEEPDRTADLGDAPDSSNSFKVGMMAYPSACMLTMVVPAHFPTVYKAGSPPFGPIHWNPGAVAFLGARVSLEQDADLGFDQDQVNNLLPLRNQADLDRADDALQMPLVLPQGRMAQFKYLVSVVRPIDELYVNVWFDWNRDGDWDDTIPVPTPAHSYDRGPAREWAVQNQVLSNLGAGIHGVLTPWFLSWHTCVQDAAASPMWMRITLSEKPWRPALASTPPGQGGSGPAQGYWIGETEDYLFQPILRRVEPADLDGDAATNLLDLAIFAEQWMKQ